MGEKHGLGTPPIATTGMPTPHGLM